MEETKKWWQSKAVLAALVTGICGVLTLFGVREAAQAAAEAEPIADNIIGLVAIVGSVLAIWGRIVAKKEIG